MTSQFIKLSSLLMLLILLTSYASLSFANEIYINQSGSSVDIDITQDGENNRVSTKSTAQSPATLYGNNQTINFSQTGDNNKIGLYKHYYGSDGQTSSTMTAEQLGSDNTMYLDNHGDDNNIYAIQKTHNSIMDLEIDYDSNTVYARQRCSRGSNCEQDHMILNAYTANNNTIKMGQGYNISTSGNWEYDGTEYGGHYMNLLVTGDRNNITLSSRNNDSNTEHTQNVNVYSDDNNVQIQQTHGHDKTATLNIYNDDNTVLWKQIKNAGHTGTVSLNGSYGTNLSVTQKSNSTAQSYSLSQTCNTVGGCSISVTQE